MEKLTQTPGNDSVMDVDDESDEISEALKEIELKLNNQTQISKFMEYETSISIEPGYLLTYQIHFLMDELCELKKKKNI